MGTVIGIDVGTTSICALMLRTHPEARARSATVENDAWIKSSDPAIKEQDARIVWQRVADALKALADTSGVGALRAEGVAFTGQMHGMLLVDSRNRVLCSPGGAAAPAALDSALVPLLSAPNDDRGGARAAHYRDSAGREMVAAMADVSAGWTVIAQRPAAEVLAVGRGLRQQTIYWVIIALVAALAAGLYLAQGIHRPIAQLTHAAKQLEAGHFEHRIGSRDGDEFGELAAAFDRMGAEIERRDAEIQEWNEQLQRRVEQRTAELKEAYEQLGQSQKVAAMSSFGAGVATEITKPLTGLLGTTQLLLARARSDPSRTKEAALLEGAEHEAQRIRELVKRLQSLSQRLSAEHLGQVSVHDLLDATARLLADEAADRGAVIERAFAADELTVQGNFTHLQQALYQVLANAIEAVDSGGTIRLRTRSLTQDKQVELAIVDDGSGMPSDVREQALEPFYSTKAIPRAEGLGLAIALRIVQDHHGMLQIVSQAGEGTTVTIRLPRA